MPTSNSWNFMRSRLSFEIFEKARRDYCLKLATQGSYLRWTPSLRCNCPSLLSGFIALSSSWTIVKLSALVRINQAFRVPFKSRSLSKEISLLPLTPLGTILNLEKLASITRVSPWVNSTIDKGSKSLTSGRKIIQKRRQFDGKYANLERVSNV